jgi:two-component system, LytTR family, response regulator
VTLTLPVPERRVPERDDGASTWSVAVRPPADELPPDRLDVRKLNREYVLSVSDIDRIEADGNYVTVHAQGTAYPRRESLIALERRLNGGRFVRVHRGHLINVDRIREIQPWDHGDYRVVLHDGTCVNLSRRYRSRLDHLLG